MREIKFNFVEVVVLDRELLKLMVKGVVEKVLYFDDEYILIVFLCFKKDGNYCVILNLK